MCGVTCRHGDSRQTGYTAIAVSYTAIAVRQVTKRNARSLTAIAVPTATIYPFGRKVVLSGFHRFLC